VNRTSIPIPEPIAQLQRLRRSGLSKSQIARQLNIGRTSVRRILALKEW